MCKICRRCKGVMNYDPYFEAEVCSSCGKMERTISKKEARKQAVFQTHRIEILRQIAGVRFTQ